ncbi:MAG: type effector Hrp-dependent outer [Clostridia bacterium]|nr:type effector Hrp-dependent outer [Clostridia bacterium]
MPDVVIIADDLTGANATSVLLAKDGYKACTFIRLEAYSEKDSSDFNIISISTDSRAIAKEEAYARVANTAKFFKDKNIKLFTKRIDSTLRGNIGAEVDALLDNLDEDSIAVLVSSFPSSGRVTIGGYLMVNSIPLEKTDVAKDPKTPVHTSCVQNLVSEQSKYKVGFIALDRVFKGAEALRQNIIDEKANGSKIIIIDATTNEDIDIIAKAVRMTGLSVVAVDPGPFTAALVKELVSKPAKSRGQKVFVTIGSVSNLTRKQIDELRMRHNPLLVHANPGKLIYDDNRAAEIVRVTNKLLNEMDEFEVIGLITTNSEDEVLDLRKIAKELHITEDDVAQRISDGLADITKLVLQQSGTTIGGLYTSGGDVTVAVCKELEAAGIAVKDEVLPLAAYGRIVKGKYNHMPIITKGGLVGDTSALTKCVDYLLTKISTEFVNGKN